MLKQRIATAAILLVIVFAAIFALPNLYWSITLVGVVLVGGFEWSKLSHHSKLSATVFGLTLLLSCGAILVVNTLASDLVRNIVGLFVYGAALLFWGCLCPIWLAKKYSVTTPLILSIAGWIVLIPTWLALSNLQNNVWILIMTFCFVWLMDSAAYFVGRKLGKHKLAPNISPKKTWEGVAAAYVAVTIYMLLIYFFHWEGSGNILIYLLVMYLVAALSIEGDLFESWIKRQAGVKDSGTLLPGHGGILDRIDSLTATTPVIALLLLLFPLQHR
jgi:phosphatidate cytidylyltransferase